MHRVLKVTLSSFRVQRTDWSTWLPALHARLVSQYILKWRCEPQLYDYVRAGRGRIQFLIFSETAHWVYPNIHTNMLGHDPFPNRWEAMSAELRTDLHRCTR